MSHKLSKPLSIHSWDCLRRCRPTSMPLKSSQATSPRCSYSHLRASATRPGNSLTRTHRSKLLG
ncbi:hypothetical protein BX600DRAFT_464606 [Xylariales sp. PMI_506]|nr:hypothetical protein BX600DRAFT_464606 [Xylariales sp. PMI_506]